MGSAMLQFLAKEHFTPDGLPREGANVISWGPPENRQRERYLEKYGAKTDDDRNFLRSLSTNATPKKVEQKPPTVKASQASVVKAEPEKIEPTPQPVKSKKTRGQTIMDPFATKDVTYRKKLLGD